MRRRERERERRRDTSLLSLSLSWINTASHREDVSFRRFASRLDARVIADARHSVIAICSTVLLSREVRFIAREFRSERKSKGNVFPCFVGARERERERSCVPVRTESSHPAPTWIFRGETNDRDVTRLTFPSILSENTQTDRVD